MPRPPSTGRRRRSPLIELPGIIRPPAARPISPPCAKAGTMPPPANGMMASAPAIASIAIAVTAMPDRIDVMACMPPSTLCKPAGISTPSVLSPETTLLMPPAMPDIMSVILASYFPSSFFFMKRLPSRSSLRCCEVPSDSPPFSPTTRSLPVRSLKSSMNFCIMLSYMSAGIFSPSKMRSKICCTVSCGTSSPNLMALCTVCVSRLMSSMLFVKLE